MQDSRHVMKKLEKIQLPQNAKLFTSDAVSMYTNIETEHGLDIMNRWLIKLEEEGKIAACEFPRDLIINLLKLVMENSMFQFGDTYFLQLSGTAMGTSVACVYAYLYSGWKETQDILPEYNPKTELLFHGRLIDDIFGIWAGDNTERWEHYNENLNDFRPGKLEWETSPLSDSVNFLDLTISIGSNGQLKYSTHQKPYNLHLYVPNHSAHPKGTVKSLVIGSIERYWRQNSRREDYQKIVALLFQRLLARGFEYEKLVSIFKEAAEYVDKKQQWSNVEKQQYKERRNTGDETLIFHREFHPRDTGRKTIQQAFRTHMLKENDNLTKTKVKSNDVKREGISEMGINRMIIAYSRPKNLWDLLCPSKLYLPPNQSVRNYFKTTEVKKSTNRINQSITNPYAKKK